MINIKSIRKSKGITVKELADTLGISQSFMTRLENGQRELSLDLALKLADALDCLVTDLITEESSSSNLSDMRKIIDTIDKSIAILFDKRMNIVKDVMEFKRLNGIKVTDKAREQEILNKNIVFVRPEFKDYYESFLDYLLTLSKEQQKKHNV